MSDRNIAKICLAFAIGGWLAVLAVGLFVELKT